MKLNKTVASFYLNKNVQLIEMLKRIVKIAQDMEFKFVYPVEVNNIYGIDGRRTGGQCQVNGKMKRTFIALNVAYVENCLKNNHLDYLENTLIHEVCHSLKGAQNHGAQWKYYADLMGRAFNQEITRLMSEEKCQMLPPRVKKTIANCRYRLFCPTCGAQWLYKTKCNAIKYPDTYRCRKCKTILESEVL